MRKVFKWISNLKSKLARVLGIVVVYLLFWLVFYGLVIVLPEKWTLYIAEEMSVLISVYIFGIVPLVSFFIPVYILRHMRAKPWIMYITHILILIVFIVAYFVISLLRIYTSVGAEDFIQN